MIWLLKNWKLVTGILLMVGAFAAGWKLGSDSVQKDWNADKLERSQAALAASIANQKNITKLEETKNANLKEIERLRAGNNAYRLRLPTTICNSTPTGDTGTTGNGQLPEEVSSRAEQAVNAFDRAYADESYRADKVIEDCRVVVDWARSFNPN